MAPSPLLRHALFTLTLLLSASCRPRVGDVIGETIPAPDEPEQPGVAISEIMYHPVLENDAHERHEFVELHNPASSPRSLSGWKLVIGGKQALVLPETAALAPGGYLVLARDRQRLIADRGLPAELVLGDYQGELDNGGDTVALLDDQGAVVDVVRYDDQLPWPMGADALGASGAWFPDGEYDRHQYRGRSLERWSYALPPSECRNWAASPTGGGTPAAPNTVWGEPPAVVMQVSPRGTVVKPGVMVPVSVRLSLGAIGQLAVEYHLDDLAAPEGAEPPVEVTMTYNDDSEYTALLPALPGRSIVRYRILNRRPGQPSEVLSPRSGDPYSFHLLFVEPDPAPPANAYQIFISPARWTEMWTNLGGGPNDGCELNPTWDAQVPAVAIHGGRVYDVRVRYQGSRYRRWHGSPLPPFPAGTGPTQPAENKTLSWRLSFPRYSRWGSKGDQRQTVTLNKQYDGCPGVLNSLASKLHWAAGVRTQRFRFARLYVNGTYYHYMMEVESIDEDLLGKTAPAETLGDLFKSDGVLGHQGPWTSGNFRPVDVNPFCPARWSKLQRYQSTYERQTHEWKNGDPAGHQELIGIIEALEPLYTAAKASEAWGPVREHLDRHFDIRQLLTSFAARNFAGVWDDGVHNFYLYRRARDGKHEVLPQDFDLEFGVVGTPASASIYTGEEGAGQDPAGGVNLLKSAVIKAYRDEFRDRFAELVRGVLSQANVLALLDEALADWDQKSWDESPAQDKCDVAGQIDAVRTWLAARYVYLAERGIQ
jgi:spore coat protein CotH